MSSNFKKSSKLIALDQISIFNDIVFTADKIRLGVPKVLDMRVDITNDENTFVNVNITDGNKDISAEESGYIYRRLELTDILGNKTFTTYRQFPLKVSDLLDDINREFELSLVEDDIVDKTVLNPISPFSFKVSPSNPAWIGDDIRMTINYIVPAAYRTTENGSMRLTENGLPRELN